MSSSDVQARFDKAVAYIRNLPKDGPVKPSNDQKLKFYGYFKQATVGTCQEKGGDRPGFLSMEARSKWDAWNAVGADMSAEDAMKAYCEALDGVSPKWEEE